MDSVFVAILCSSFPHGTATESRNRKYKKIGCVYFLKYSCSSLWNLTAPLNKHHYRQIAFYFIRMITH